MRYLILFLLTSCSSVRVSQSLIDPAFGLHVKPETNQISAAYTSVQAEETVWETDYFQLMAGIGPTFTQPIDGRSAMWGVEVTDRLVFKNRTGYNLFLYQAFGMSFHDSRWQGSDTSYEFTTQIGIGIVHRITDRFEVDLSYSYWHASNGKTFFGDKTRQLFSLKTAEENEGFESGAITLGIVYRF